MPLERLRSLRGLRLSYRSPASIADFLARRFRAQDVAILSCRGHERTVFRDLPQVGRHTLARVTGVYDLFDNQIHSAGQTLFDTVRRFKGQQSAAVVPVDIDHDARRLAQELPVLFRGMTRATVRLEPVCRGDNPVVAERILSAR